MNISLSEKKAATIVGVLTVVVLGLVTLMYNIKLLHVSPNFPNTILPAVHALINGLVAVALLLALRAVKMKNIELHRKMMITAVGLSTLFLVSYVAQHSLFGSTPYGGTGVWRPIYFFILITHILLAGVSFPLILWTLYLSLSNKIQKHKKLAKWVWPIWFYVSITGVLVYLFMRNFY